MSILVQGIFIFILIFNITTYISLSRKECKEGKLFIVSSIVCLIIIIIF